MTFAQKLISRFTALLVAFFFSLSCFVFFGYGIDADAAYLYNQNGVFLCEAFNIAGGNLYNEPRSQWISFLDKYSSSDYYIGTPFDDWLYSASPRGDNWQYKEGYRTSIISGGGSAELGGMNSTGFIWHAVAKSLSEGSGLGMSVTGKWVPMLNGFNSNGFSHSCWEGGNNRWYDFINKYQVRYYEFSTKSEMLSSGVLGKGDIIWCVDSTVGNLMSGLSIPADNHHVGIYMGNGSSDLWWQTGPVNGDGDFSAQYNSINPIYGCAASSTYIVLPWDGVRVSDNGTYTQRSTRTVRKGLKNPDGNFFSYGIKAAGGFDITLRQWQSFITQYTSNDYYIGTPYSTWLFAASPRGDMWQYNEGSKDTIVSSGGSDTNGGLNCMGFVWHALAKGISVTSGKPLEAAGRSIPFNLTFNTMFSRQSWWGGGWIGYLSSYNIKYYEFSTKSEMLGSGALRKGDIIWCVDGSCGVGLNGLRQLSDNHHIGIYTGNGSSDEWWQSGPTLGDHNFSEQRNSINPIYGCALSNTYVVIPFADEFVSEPTTTVVTATSTTTTTTTTTTTSTTTTSTVTTTTAAQTASTSDATSCAVSLSADAVRLISRSGITPADIISAAEMNGEPIAPEKLSFGSMGEPQLEFHRDNDCFVCTLNIYSDNQLFASPIVTRVLKGDVNQDGTVNSVDASIALACYSKISVGEKWAFTDNADSYENLLTERMSYLAADIDTESVTKCSEQGSTIDSTDASLILQYYSKSSVGITAEWD